MAKNFNTNQNRHLYVVTNYGEVDETKDAGMITVKSSGEGNDKRIYLVYKGADTVMHSELIDPHGIDYVKGVSAKDLRVAFKSQKVKLSEDVNDGNPVAGQEYILRIVLRQWIGMSEEDVYFKEAAVHATAKMDAAAFYKAMVDSLNYAFAREIGATLKKSTDGSGNVKIEGSNPYLSFTAEADGIVIAEKEQPWHLGIESQEPVLFDAVPTTIYSDGADVQWGTVTTTTAATAAVKIKGEADTPTGYGNGHNIADLEYFCMGERGDQYRMVGFPNVVPTKYLVDPSKEYSVVEIHHAFRDSGVNSYRSEKDITLVSTDASKLNEVIKAINTAAGTTFKQITVAE